LSILKRLADQRFEKMDVVHLAVGHRLRSLRAFRAFHDKCPVGGSHRYVTPQHFLLSPKARTLTLRQVFGMSEEDAYTMFKSLRWPETMGAPVCPACGGLDYWTLVEDCKWKCKHAECRIQFTVTSRTILASRKMAYRDLLAAIAITVNGVLGTAAGRMIREMGFVYKTAFVLAHKLREAMSVDYDQQLEGVVEIDGAYIGDDRAGATAATS